MGSDLEQYPLAKASGWKAPKQDTGGILYLYPSVTNVTRPCKHGTDAVFKYNTRERPHALNPDDLHRIEFKETGDPKTNVAHRKPAKLGESK